MKRILVSAGDPSGDLILSKVIAELKEQASSRGDSIEFVGLCGPASQALGVKPLANAVDVAVVGLVEVVRNLRKIFGVLNRLSAELTRVDSVLCVDFPDFNLKLAEMAFKKKVPVDFVVAPQLWAWRSGRMPQLKRVLRTLYPALPFEETIFREGGVEARYMGHPIRDLLPPRARREARDQLKVAMDEFLVCVMPGSRRGEIDRHLPLLLEAIRELRVWGDRKFRHLKVAQWKFVLPMAPGWTEERLLENIGDEHRRFVTDEIKAGRLLLISDSRRALMASDFGWITSGTATLEAAYYQLPHVLVYRLSWISAFLIRQMTSYFSDPNSAAGLPNILLGKKAFPEILQGSLTSRRLVLETLELLSDASRMALLRKDLRWIPGSLGKPGASVRIAQDLALNLWPKT